MDVGYRIPALQSFLMNVGGTKLKRQELSISSVSFRYYPVMVGCLAEIKLWLILETSLHQ